MYSQERQAKIVDLLGSQSSVSVSDGSAPIQTEEDPADQALEQALEQYRLIVSQADSYSYSPYPVTPTGSYRYALVQLETDDPVPTLLLSQEEDNYSDLVLLFQYDPETDQVIHPEESLEEYSGGGGYASGLSLQGDGMGLGLSEIAGGTGSTVMTRITLQNGALVREEQWSGRMDAVEAAPAAPAADDTAPLRDELSECGRSLSELAGRVAALEEGAHGASDAMLKESLEAACQASETTLRSALDSARQDRNDLLAALPGLVAEAVRQAVGQAAAPAAVELPEGLREELDRLGVQCRSMAARLDALEKRLDDMQPAFNANIEKAAAAAMSRLLNEQIARLTQE